MLMYKQSRTFKKGGREMTGIQVYKNTAGNVGMSQMVIDMERFSEKLSMNGTEILKKGQVVGGILGNGIVAVNPTAGLKIPMYLRKTQIIPLRLPTIQ